MVDEEDDEELKVELYELDEQEVHATNDTSVREQPLPLRVEKKESPIKTQQKKDTSPSPKLKSKSPHAFLTRCGYRKEKSW